MNQEVFYLQEFKPGDFMLWSVCSQCLNTFSVVIRDDSKIYATVRKSTKATDLQKLSQDSAFYGGGENLRIEVEFDKQSVDIQESTVSGGIVGGHSRTVGYSYTYCLEDEGDEDYNDVYIAIIAWRKHG